MHAFKVLNLSRVKEERVQNNNNNQLYFSRVALDSIKY